MEHMLECVLGVLKDFFMLKYLPQLGDNTSIGLLFVFGILTSFHCVGMCGGIAISQTVKNTAVHSGRKSWLFPSAFYNAGRVASYTVVGGIAGGLGQAISLTGLFRGIIPIAGGLFMIIMAANLLGIAPALLRRLNISMPGFAARILLKKRNEGKGHGPLIVGLLSGLMPCGPLQIIQLYALSTGSIIYGAASLFVFSIGTVPVLFIFGALNTYINKNHSKLILRFSAVLVLVLGFVMMGRGVALVGLNTELFNSSQAISISVPKSSGDIRENIQIINSELTESGYPQITVCKDIPVRWNIYADEKNLNDCNNAIVIPKLNLEKQLVAGDNIIEFTPGEAGTIPYTCWMGMIKSKITVIDK